MNLPAELVRLVVARAGGRCEYCRMHQSLQGATFHIEHIIPRSRGGMPEAENLAWCCPSCNLHKSDRVDALDPPTRELVPLFDPRRQEWSEHFQWSNYEVAGKTPIGRATVILLRMNDVRRIQIRRAEQTFELFPPDAQVGSC